MKKVIEIILANVIGFLILLAIGIVGGIERGTMEESNGWLWLFLIGITILIIVVTFNIIDGGER